MDNMRVAVLLMLATLAALALVMGCATTPEAPEVDEPVLPDLSGVQARAGHLAEDAMAGTQYGGVNVTATADGNPAAGITVYLIPSTVGGNLNAWPHIDTDAAGTASFRNVPPVAGLRLWVVEGARSASRPLAKPVAGRVDSYEVDVVTGGGSTGTELDGVTGASGHLGADAMAGSALAGINVTVLDGGKPLANQVVNLIPDPIGDQPIGTFPSAVTDSQGRVSFRDVPLNVTVKVRVQTSDQVAETAVTGAAAGVVSPVTVTL